MMKRPRYQKTAPISALQGMVKIHAQTMVPANPQRTAERRLVAPTPMTAEVMVWVVEIGASKTYAVE